VEISTHFNSRCLPRLAVSHGGAKLIELRSPRHGVSRTPGRPKHCSRQYDRDGGLRARDKPCGSRYRPPRRSDQCASITRLSSGQRAIRSAGIASSARALPHLRPRHRRTSHPVAAYRGGHQNSSYSRSSGSKERNQSLSRHLAARTLCGSLAEIRQGSTSLADGGVLL
jgi:hypothetical protein